jgi:hypothetical protein
LKMGIHCFLARPDQANISQAAVAVNFDGQRS